ncbi:hypothetical protein [Actinopolymorpha alba]|uniref:hypothetical protein n=1 Tax=Actinopolymorpha alba TaxID=533267 RepID=UPI000375F622|nr:hypothetical protein [Actinopolymorpha alba]
MSDAGLASATMRGLVLTALSTPDLATWRAPARPFGTTRLTEWSQPAMGIVGIAVAFLEPDPMIEWNDERLAEVRQGLERPDHDPAGAS